METSIPTAAAGHGTEAARPPPRPTIFRGFWHGSPLGPYQLLCLRSFLAQGHGFELFTYDPDIRVPDWVARRDAREILPCDHVMVYRSGWGAGSPSLHSNLFRYAMLHRLGGWWVDLDVMLLRPDLPGGEEFFFHNGRGSIASAVLRFPARDPLLAEAVRRSRAVSEDAALWGQTGPRLMDALVTEHGRRSRAFPPYTAFPLGYDETDMLFDPARSDEVRGRCAGAWFLHLFHQLNRSSGIPREAGPPEGSYLDRMFRDYDIDARFDYRLRHADVKTWIGNFLAYLHYESRYRQVRAEAERLESRCRELEAAVPGPAAHEPPGR